MTGIIPAVTLTLADEAPLNPPDPTPTWSENYCFDMFDADRNIAVWLHVGRWWRDPEVWREQVIVLLPDGRSLIARQYGRADVREGVVGSSLSLRFTDPGKAIEIGYVGAVFELPEVAPDVRVPQSAAHGLRLDLRLSATGPVWDFGGGEGREIRGSGHIEQPFRAVGQIVVDGEALAFDGCAYRDHSRGPRDIAPFGGHVYLHGQFPDGRAFGLYDVSMRSGDGVASIGAPRAVVYDQGVIHEATVDMVPRISRHDDPAASFTIRFDSAVGAMAIEVTPRRRTSFTVSAPFDYWSGIQPSIGVAAIIEDFATFRWDGQQGAGLVERSCIFR